MVIPTLKTCYFEASEDIMTKFKSQALHKIRIKHWKASGSGNPPSLIPALQKIAFYVLNTYVPNCLYYFAHNCISIDDTYNIKQIWETQYIASNNKNERIRGIVTWFIEKIAYTSLQLYRGEKYPPLNNNSNNMYLHF